MKVNENEILTIAGKRVRVSYAGKGSKCCEMCCFCSDYGCTGVGAEKEWPCKKFGTETAYFVEAEKDYKGLYEELVNSEWYKKYYQGASVGDSVAVEQSEEETHTLREWAQILATNPDLRAEFNRICPPQSIQGSIAPDADLEAEIFAWQKAHATEETKQIIAMTSRHFAEWERARIEPELRLAWGKISKDPFDVDDVFRALLEHLKR